MREIVGNRNYSRKARFGEGRLPRADDDLPRRGRGTFLGVGLVFGIVFGAILSNTTANAAWIGIGVTLGIVFGATFSMRK